MAGDHQSVEAEGKIISMIYGLLLSIMIGGGLVVTMLLVDKGEEMIKIGMMKNFLN